MFEQAVVDSDEPKTRQPSIATDEISPSIILAYSSFINKFNGKYSPLQEQKDLLNHFITSFADDGFELRLYLNEELSRLKGLLSEVGRSRARTPHLQKVSEVVEYLEGFRKREFTDTDLNKVLKTQELAQELIANDHN